MISGISPTSPRIDYSLPYKQTADRIIKDVAKTSDILSIEKLIQEAKEIKATEFYNGKSTYGDLRAAPLQRDYAITQIALILVGKGMTERGIKVIGEAQDTVLISETYVKIINKIGKHEIPFLIQTAFNRIWNEEILNQTLCEIYDFCILKQDKEGSSAALNAISLIKQKKNSLLNSNHGNIF